MTPADQYRAATETVAMFDASDRVLIEVTGRDRATFLHSFCTNDVKKLQPGQGCEAFVTNVKGRVLGHVLIFAENESLWISGDPGTQTPLLSHLNRYIITEDVELRDRTAECSQMLICGTGSPSALIEALGIETAGMQMCGRSAATDQVGIGLRRVPLTVVAGFLTTIAPAAKSDVLCHLQSQNATTADDEILELFRLEAMWPRYGVNITEDHLAQEAGRTAQAISFTKGCYLGQEPIARLDALGHTNRELRGIRFETPGEVTAGTKVLDAAGTAEVGAISSVATHPITNCPVALVMLKTVANAPGTTVLARTSRGTDIRGIVFSAPSLV